MSRNKSGPAFELAADGWCSGAVRVASPNFDARPDGAAIDLLVIHNISLPPGEFGASYIEDFFCNRLDHDAHPYFDHLRGVRVSAHFLIRRNGAVVQFVAAGARAWHAGQSAFGGRERCNDFSIGVELEGSDFEPFDDRQYHSLAELSCALQQHYPLTHVAGHEHIAPGRKTDPGPFFDWVRYGERYRGALREYEPLALTNGALTFPAAP
jgi:AmpD protein